MSNSDEKGKQRIHEMLAAHVPDDVFRFALHLFNAAAKGDVPDAHIKPAPDDDAPSGGWRLTNIPENRGMLAVMNETRHLSRDQRMGLNWRIMSFGTALDLALEDSRFARHVHGERDGVLEVSSQFTSAYAKCPFLLFDERDQPDMDWIWNEIKDTDPED